MHAHAHTHVCTTPPHTHTHLSFVTQLTEGSLSRMVAQWNIQQNTGIHRTTQCHDLMTNTPTKTERVKSWEVVCAEVQKLLLMLNVLTATPS